MPLPFISTLTIGIILLGGVASAQELPEAPAKPAPSSFGAGAYNYLYRAGFACGVGASTSPAATKPTAQCGGILGLLPFFDLEAGVLGPQANRSDGSGYLSTNVVAPLFLPHREANRRGFPLLVGGYTRMFETGHALNYGLAYAHTIDSTHSIQFEVLDDWAFANPNQHNVVYRVVWLVGLPD